MKKIFVFLIIILSRVAILYSQTNTEPYTIRGFVVDQDSKTKIGALVEVSYSSTHEKIYNKVIIADSGFVFTIPADQKNTSFDLWVKKAGYETFMQGVSARLNKDGILLIRIRRLMNDTKTVLFSAINFDYDQSLINSQSQKQLDSAVTYLKKYPDVKIEIEGHTDNTGTDDYNLPLSQQRADEVKDYLVSKGIDAKRIMKSTGIGSSKPVDSNETDVGKAKNRRVEIRLVK